MVHNSGSGCHFQGRDSSRRRAPSDLSACIASRFVAKRRFEGNKATVLKCLGCPLCGPP